MPYIALDELPLLFDDKPCWSAKGRALGEFRRSDFLGDPDVPLVDEVRRRITEETGQEHRGEIFLLANLRYFGHIMNPISCYYCYNAEGTALEYIVAEVNNTPWDERHNYVLPVPDGADWLQTEFDKTFHVSPFNPMAMRYHWRSNTPGDRLVLHMENREQGERVFDATLSMSAQPMTAENLNKQLLRYPLMTAKVGIAIYWQALRLFVKGVPVYAHPEKTVLGAENE